ENRGRRADAKRQRQSRDGGERPGVPEQPNADPCVADHVPEHRVVLTLRLFTRPSQQEARMIKTRIVAAVLAVFAIATPALAGPPLLCHPFDIGSAKSLPWLGAKSWDEGQPGYRLDRLVTDTEALLTPSTPVIVRM